MHTGHRQRLKNRFLSEGLGSFEDHEVLELLLYYAIPQGDTNPLAHRLLEKFSTLNSVFNASLQELCEVDGVREHTATLIKLIPHISQFYTSLLVREKKTLQNSQEAGLFVCAMIGCLKNEVFGVICLDAQRRVLAFELLEQGTVSRANVHPRKVIECALRHNAESVILAHNHPAGTAYASEEDRHLTNVLCPLLEGIGIRVIDHIIAASPEIFVSMANSGLMPN